jgi:DNA replication protein DnaC
MRKISTFLLEAPSNKERGEHISFSQALYSNYSDAVSYIQAYLKERDILYPRHIIENFLTLIRTNDLIILAGDSGSGKTNLVQSFAKAIVGYLRSFRLSLTGLVQKICWAITIP